MNGFWNSDHTYGRVSDFHFHRATPLPLERLHHEQQSSISTPDKLMIFGNYLENLLPAVVRQVVGNIDGKPHIHGYHIQVRISSTTNSENTNRLLFVIKVFYIYLFNGLSILAMPVPGSDFGLRDRPGPMEIKVKGKRYCGN